MQDTTVSNVESQSKVPGQKLKRAAEFILWCTNTASSALLAPFWILSIMFWTSIVIAAIRGESQAGWLRAIATDAATASETTWTRVVSEQAHLCGWLLIAVVLWRIFMAEPVKQFFQDAADAAERSYDGPKKSNLFWYLTCIGFALGLVFLVVLTFHVPPVKQSAPPQSEAAKPTVITERESAALQFNDGTIHSGKAKVTQNVDGSFTVVFTSK